jgi:hypothetical protein
MKKVIFLSLVSILIISGCSLTKPKDQVKELSLEEAKVKAETFIKDNLVQPGTSVTLKDASIDNGLYKVVVTIPRGNNQPPMDYDFYMTKDGNKLFTQAIDIAEFEQKVKDQQAQQQNNQAQAPKDVPKSDKPEVELYVMAFCPYGVGAENTMGPVYDLLGKKANIQVRYIANISGDDINKVSSLHGVTEGIEDARQLCVKKYYGDDVFWKYVLAINKNCYSLYNQADQYDNCWKKSALDSGASADKLTECISKEGAALIKEEETASSKNGVSGSPTLIINGAQSSAARTPEGYKTAICNAFNTQPEECTKTLSGDTGATASGGCN